MRQSLIWVLFLLFACSKKPTEEAAEAVDRALTYLSEDQCQEAIDLLEDVGRQDDDAVYLQVLASAYACRAGYSTISFVESDVPDIDSAGTDFLKSLSILSLSGETQADSSSYQDLRTALGISLGGSATVQPSQARRNSDFGPRKAGDLGMLSLFLGVVQLGKFLNFYGNVGPTGAKGAGAANQDEQGAVPSTCFIDYTDAAAITWLEDASAPGGACDDMATDAGHPNLSLAAGSLAVTKARLCEGLVLVTNVLDILNNVALPNSSSLSVFGDVVDTVNDFRAEALAVEPALATLLATTSQAACEELVADNTEFGRLQLLYALLFETGLP